MKAALWWFAGVAACAAFATPVAIAVGFAILNAADQEADARVSADMQYNADMIRQIGNVRPLADNCVMRTDVAVCPSIVKGEIRWTVLERSNK